MIPQTKAQNHLPMAMFAAASLMPALLLGMAIWRGGAWGAAPLIFITGAAASMDLIAARLVAAPDARRETPQEAAEFPASQPLLVLLALLHLALLPLLVRAIVGQHSTVLFISAALWLGQICTPAAHELIHRGHRGLFSLGAAIYASILFGHHTSAHRLVHHRLAATPQDPNTARSGEGYYAFLLRAWCGSFTAGLRAENALRARQSGNSSGHNFRRIHPYAFYIAAAVASLIFGAALAGEMGALIWAALAICAQMQLMLSDYVQHYGLMRRKNALGQYEPVAARHSWNAPYWFSSAMMLNAPRHSDHHVHPARAYPALRLPPNAPMLPWPLPLACTIALIPPLWKRAIRPHLKPWLI